jgi:hypothetical protein
MVWYKRHSSSNHKKQERLLTGDHSQAAVLELNKLETNQVISPKRECIQINNAFVAMLSKCEIKQLDVVKEMTQYMNQLGIKHPKPLKKPSNKKSMYMR